MLVYHGSLEFVEHPRILVPNRTLDYGSGFYVTTSEIQAEQWVSRKLDSTQKEGFVNVYELDLSKTNSLKVLSFENPSEEWLDFVMRNRTDANFKHDYDIVYGPVANDRVYAAFALYEAGFLNKTELIRELKTYRLVDQYLFHTEKALEILTFQTIKTIRL